jgi:hypothetical protein
MFSISNRAQRWILSLKNAVCVNPTSVTTTAKIVTNNVTENLLALDVGLII